MYAIYILSLPARRIIRQLDKYERGGTRRHTVCAEGRDILYGGCAGHRSDLGEVDPRVARGEMSLQSLPCIYPRVIRRSAERGSRRRRARDALYLNHT